MAFCKVCGYDLGPPDNAPNEIHDPKGLLGEVIENDSAHLKVIDGPNENDHRYMCRPSGKTTAIVDPDEVQGEGGPEPSSSEKSERPVYDTPEDKSPGTVLAETVTNPSYELTEDQIDEIRDWAEIYDGQLPADMLEDILKNMSGVNKQKAKLVRQKYEAKLNKWVRQQNDEEGGPPIGVTAPPPTTGSSGPTPHGGPPSPSGGPPSPPPEPEPNLSRREKRLERRQKALDKAVEEAAGEMADAMAREFSAQFGWGLDVIRTVIKKKAEKDPDWFLEKAEQWDIDVLDEFLQPSESRRREMEEEDTRPPVDAEVDEALEQSQQRPGPAEQVEFPDEELPTQDQQQTPEENPMDELGYDDVEEEPEEELEDEEFDSIFSDMEGVDA